MGKSLAEMLMEGAMGNPGGFSGGGVPRNASPDELRQMQQRYAQVNAFKPGDIVRWKAGLKNRKLPAQDGVAVVLEVEHGRRIAHSEARISSPYENEACALRIALFDRDGDFSGYWVDENRFELVKD